MIGRVFPLLLGFAFSAAAQSGAPKVHAVAGVVVDSLRGRPLAGAEIVLEGTPHRAISDSLGRFRLENVSPGTYRAGFFHPLLDSLSISLGTRGLSVPIDTGKVVLLAVPSSLTMMKAFCPAAPAGSAAVVGRVLDPESEEPVKGANVFLSWTDFEATKERGLVRTPRTMRATTDASGAYRLCGLPPELDALLVASIGASATSPTPVAMTREGVLVKSVTLLPPGAAAGAVASLNGVVRSKEGQELSGARINVPGAATTATTAANGRFTLGGLPPGTRTVIVRRVGFFPALMSVDLTSRETRNVNIVLEKYVSTLDTVIVRASRERALAQVGFVERRKQGLGDFRTRAEFVKTNPRVVSDILVGMRGVKIQYVDGKAVVGASREEAGCVQMVVDGVPWHTLEAGDIDDMVYPEDIAAVEVYSGAATPMSLEGVQTRGCLTVVLWTRTKIREARE
ncbi:MAG TPA: carboxypeptidase regulatory-like domain-containing protein [Gemmatimonadaceae bacterium]|nr:carboxypeptidase regulatory-like domain-containing protein [Gemmatimonadaceae bacterium]